MKNTKCLRDKNSFQLLLHKKMAASGKINLEQLCFYSVCGTYNAINHPFTAHRSECPKD